MNAMEKRQANRIVRNARAMEKRIFDLIDELQSASLDDEDYDWQCCIDQLRMIESDLPLLFDLARNVQREKKERNDP